MSRKELSVLGMTLCLLASILCFSLALLAPQKSPPPLAPLPKIISVKKDPAELAAVAIYDQLGLFNDMSINSKKFSGQGQLTREYFMKRFGIADENDELPPYISKVDEIELRSGKHLVEVKSDRLRKTFRMEVDLRPGENLHIAVLPTGMQRYRCLEAEPKTCTPVQK